MTSSTHEHTLNVATRGFGKVGRREVSTGQAQVVALTFPGPLIEAERSNHASAEEDAKARLGRTVAITGPD